MSLCQLGTPTSPLMVSAVGFFCWTLLGPDQNKPISPHCAGKAVSETGPAQSSTGTPIVVLARNKSLRADSSSMQTNPACRLPPAQGVFHSQGSPSHGHKPAAVGCCGVANARLESTSAFRF